MPGLVALTQNRRSSMLTPRDRGKTVVILRLIIVILRAAKNLGRGAFQVDRSFAALKMTYRKLLLGRGPSTHTTQFRPLLSLWLCPSYLRVAIPYTSKGKSHNLSPWAGAPRNSAGDPLSTATVSGQSTGPVVARPRFGAPIVPISGG